MKGFLVLTEARSGSNWLGSITNNTGQMGRSGEWLDCLNSDIRPSDYSPSEFFNLVIDKGRSGNDRFGVRVFPWHLHWVQHQCGFDFVAECLKRHETKLLLLYREDRMRQAISYARGVMTSQWTSRIAKKGPEVYNFKDICRAYFHIERSFAFWRAYLTMHGHSYAEFAYEDLLSDPTPYIRTLADQLEVETPTELRTDLKIQRDELTEKWIRQFRTDLASHNVMESAGLPKLPSRTPANLLRFLRKETMTPLPY